VIKPQFNIDEETLLQFIQYFQKHPSPIHFLASGRLLQRIIENSADENIPNSATYFEKRLLLAIDFYRKAARAPELAPKVEHILWNMRIVYHDIPAVIEKLKPYRLRPMIGVYDKFLQDTRENCPVLADDSDTEIDLSEIARKKLNNITKLEMDPTDIPNKLENAMFSVIRNYHLFGHLIHAQY
jgi:hypothetical protein